MKKMIALIGDISDYSLLISASITVLAYFVATSETMIFFWIPAATGMVVTIVTTLVSHIMAANLKWQIEHRFVFDQMVRRAKRLNDEDAYIEECMQKIRFARFAKEAGKVGYHL